MLHNTIGLLRLRVDEAGLLAAAAFMMLTPFLLSVVANIGRRAPSQAAVRRRGS